MAQPQPLTVVSILRARVITLHQIWGPLHALLTHTLPVMQTADPKTLETILLNASTKLTVAIAGMEAAEFLTHIGCIQVQALVQAGVQPPPHPALYLQPHTVLTQGLVSVGTVLRGAIPLAQDMLRHLESCRGHLWAAAFMASNLGGVPGVADSIEAQRLAAVGDFQAALQKAGHVVPLVAQIYHVAVASATN